MNRFLPGIVVLLLVLASGTAMATGAVTDPFIGGAPGFASVLPSGNVSDSTPNTAATLHSERPLSFNPGSGSLAGRITDNHGSPLPGATVYIPDLKLGVIADTAGYYRFNTLPSGRYLIEAHSVGFKTLTKTAAITGPIYAGLRPLGHLCRRKRRGGDGSLQSHTDQTKPCSHRGYLARLPGDQYQLPMPSMPSPGSRAYGPSLRAPMSPNHLSGDLATTGY